MSTVWPRCRSGAVGSKPAFTRMGLPVARDFSIRSRRSLSRMISAAPLRKQASCSSTGENEGMEFDYRRRLDRIGRILAVFNSSKCRDGRGDSVRAALFHLAGLREKTSYDDQQ